uniref:Uncharacterized protein n=1 Tax=viral metagenome TaxID=1070528 RepID=A0A6C0I3G8_9ZZZZ
MDFFKYINIPVFVVSLILGMMAMYITLPETRKIYVFPTPENIDVLQYRDKTGTCFSFKQKEVDCPKSESDISTIQPQG